MKTKIWHFLSFFSVVQLTLLVILVGTSPLFAASVTPPKKEKKATFDHAEAIKNIQGTLSFDQATLDALKRSNDPAVLLAPQEEEDHIYRIEVMGLKKVEPSAIFLRLKTKIGDEFDRILLQEDVREIERMGFFRNIQVYVKRLASRAVVLRFMPVEIPTLFEVDFQGNRAFSTDEIKAELKGLEKFQGAVPETLEENRKRIEELYVNKGYYLADVTYAVEPTKPEKIKAQEKEDLDQKVAGTEEVIDTTKVIAPDFVTVTYTIKENPKIYIERVSFVGLKRLSEDKLREAIQSKEKHWLSVLSAWGTFKEQFLEVDPLIAESILHDHGFMRAQVFTPAYTLSADKSRISIQYRFKEGPVYRLGNVSISGDLIETSRQIYKLQKEKDPDTVWFLEKNLLSEFPKPGLVFKKTELQESVSRISESYKDKGYAYVNVALDPIFNDDDHIIDVHVGVESGPKVYIERVEIAGNDKTKDEVIRRELKLDEGDLYSSSLYRLSEQSVNRLGFFETVEFSNRPGSSPDRMIITIKVVEKSTGTVQAGAAYGTGGEGIILRGQVANYNLFGRGQTVMANVNWSSYRKMFDVSFIEPYLTYLADNPLSFAFTAYNRSLFFGEFDRLSTGGDVTCGYPIGGRLTKYSRRWQRDASAKMAPYVLDFDSLWFSLTYTAERVKITDATTEALNYALFQGAPRYTTSIRPTITLDQRDNRLNPTRGYFAEFKVELASGYFGGKGFAHLEDSMMSNRKTRGLNDGLNYLKPKADANSFARYSSIARFYHNLDDWSLLKGLVFKTNFELGFLNDFGQPLLFENYSLGGMGSVRGYYYRSLSPTERAYTRFPFDPRTDLKVGGNKQVFGSMELEFPIIKLIKLKGVLFFDYGNVFSHQDNLFHFGKKSPQASKIRPADPLKLYSMLGLYSSVGFGVRWDSPMGMLRFEWGFPLVRRPAGTPGMMGGDDALGFEFNIGPSF